MDGGGDNRGGRIRAHTTGVGALISVAQAFVILTGGECQHMGTVGHDDETGLFAG